MKNKLLRSLLLTAAVSMMTVTFGAGLTFAAHPNIPLYTYEEIGMQFGMPNNMMPVMIDGQGKGFPYSPKMTCGNCHNGGTTSWDGQWSGTPLVSYNDMTNQTFHSELGAEEWQDTPGSSTLSSQPGKPWSQTNGMWGKW